MNFATACPADDGVQTTIQDLNLYGRVKHNNMTYFLYTTQETTSRDIKRMTREFTQRKIHGIHSVVPRYGNRKFHDPLSFEQMTLQNGEILLIQLRNPERRIMRLWKRLQVNLIRLRWRWSAKHLNPLCRFIFHLRDYLMAATHLRESNGQSLLYNFRRIRETPLDRTTSGVVWKIGPGLQRGSERDSQTKSSKYRFCIIPPSQKR
jgi:hypothetical protein